MMNRVVLVGRLTKDPELRYTPSGVAVANFTLAVNRPFTNQQGDREADFINVVVWRRQAENAANFLKKGSLAGVDGRVQTRSYDNSQGQRVFVTEVMAESVQFLEPKGSNQGNGDNERSNGSSSGYGGGNQNRNQGSSSNYGDDPFANDGKPIDISDDDLPF
ncbi:single-stranded DNA-binding protein [Anaerobacillus sp. 1_MG-2023]|uniref:single-stranded DNA-binding protein n=1 Tax=Anaerobacillus sp. 1_MG-2023 TaxID=3062655 RepID=UPI0026E25EC1|nr:single-stranded DNA-binding protein [Anaerobacillus sp. 1_MG-2023]MDO6657445.1 single-stranded DNA-binding protein [Anaerobacillus sp. 1_MG-2023]